MTGYGSGARLLSLGIASTGLLSFAYFSLASHALADEAYARISLLWSIVFVACSALYRPIEQLLSRTIAARRAGGLRGGHPLRTPLVLQAALAGAFVTVALALREPITDGVFDGSATLYWILVAGVVAYAASYFGRGWLAGHQRFGAYGALVFVEAAARLLFAAAAAVGLTSGQDAVAAGIAAAPLVSLIALPWAAARGRRQAGAQPPRARGRDDGLALGRGGRFALAALVIVAAEQTLLNAAVLTTAATSPDAAAAGFVFNALLVTRAPLQLFQAVQGALLPHLTGLHATADAAAFARAVRTTLLAIAGFAGAAAVALLLVGPWAMDLLFDDGHAYGRWGLAVVAAGMGLHLAAGTLTQAALARERAGAVAAAWALAAVFLIAFLLAPAVADPVLRAELGYFGAAALLCAVMAAGSDGRRARARRG